MRGLFLAFSGGRAENEIGDWDYQIELTGCLVFQLRDDFEDGLAEQQVATEESLSGALLGLGHFLFILQYGSR